MEFKVPVFLFSIFTALVLHGGDSSGGPEIFKLSDGRQLSLQEYGNPSGPLVFYFHGLNGSRIEPRLIESELDCSGIRLLAIDRPGMGQSTFQPNRSISDFVSDVEEIANSRGYRKRKFGILAVSGGTCYACACALEIPHRISRVVLISPWGPQGVPCVEPGIMDNTLRLAAALPNLAKMATNSNSRKLERDAHKTADRLLKNWLERDRNMLLCNEQNFRNFIYNLEQITDQGPRGVVYDVKIQIEDWDLDISAIKGVPVSIWSGGSDPVVTPSVPRYFHCQIKGSTLRWGKDEGHVTMLKNYAPKFLSEF